MTHDQLRTEYFRRLNSYRQSAEYADYAKEIGSTPPDGELPSLIGDRWEIDRDLYEEFLEMLPPLGWKGGTFFMSEFSFGDITSKFTKEGDRYYCEHAHYPPRNRAQSPPVETPWGLADHVTEIAPGIVSYSTPSHGGIHLSPARLAAMPKPLRDFRPWAGLGWYEEDCDWAVVALAFPQFFKPDDVTAAVDTLTGSKPELYEQFLAAGRGKGGV